MKDLTYALLLVLLTILVLGWAGHEEYASRYQAPPVMVVGGER